MQVISGASFFQVYHSLPEQKATAWATFSEHPTNILATSDLPLKPSIQFP